MSARCLTGSLVCAMGILTLAVILEVAEDMQVATSIRMVVREIRQGPEMWGDRERIAQVLVNLLSNAIKYSPESAEVHIHTKISVRPRLYIAADMVRRHGGSIIVDSEKDKGSVFTVTLPIGKGQR